MIEIKEGAIFPAQVLKEGTLDSEPWQSFQLTGAHSVVKPTIYITPPIKGLKDLDYVRLDKFIMSKCGCALIRSKGWIATYSYFFECTKVGDADGKVKKYKYSGKNNIDDFEIPEF